MTQAPQTTLPAPADQTGGATSHALTLPGPAQAVLLRDHLQQTLAQSTATLLSRPDEARALMGGNRRRGQGGQALTHALDGAPPLMAELGGALDRRLQELESLYAELDQERRQLQRAEARLERTRTALWERDRRAEEAEALLREVQASLATIQQERDAALTRARKAEAEAKKIQKAATATTAALNRARTDGRAAQLRHEQRLRATAQSARLNTEDTITYRLGELLMRCRTWRGLLRLPRNIALFRQHIRSRAERRAQRSLQMLHLVDPQEVHRRYQDQGVDGVMGLLEAERLFPSAQKRLRALLPPAVSALLDDADGTASRAKTTPTATPKPGTAPPPLAPDLAAALGRDGMHLLALWRQGGAAAIIEHLEPDHPDDPGGLAAALTDLARTLRPIEPTAALGLAEAAVGLHPTPGGLRAAFWSALEANAYHAAGTLLDRWERLPEALRDSDAEAAQALDALRTAPFYRLRGLSLVEPRQDLALHPTAGKVAYILSASLPHRVNGYATRSLGVARGLRAQGLDVVCITRPGFPLDDGLDLTPADVPAEQTVDGIRHRHILNSVEGAATSPYDAIRLAAEALELVLREERPAVVMAASNERTALPALIAARRLGLKFVYEVRGFWEITQANSDVAFRQRPVFKLQQALESAVAQAADQVLTLTGSMAEELVNRGVRAEAISLLPNAIDPGQFEPRQALPSLRGLTQDGPGQDESEQDAAPRSMPASDLAGKLGLPADVPVVGYIGSILDYEGLDDLVSACALLRQRGVSLRVLVVGQEKPARDGSLPLTQALQSRARREGLGDWLVMPGAVPFDQVRTCYDLIDIAVFPRKPWPVCELVSPLKPLEALAMGKPVIASTVAPLQEMLRDEQTGLLFAKGQPSALADQVERLIADPLLRQTLGAQGADWVRGERTWESTTGPIAPLLRGLMA